MNSRLLKPLRFVWRSLTDPRWLVMALLLTLVITSYLQYLFDPWRQYQLGLQALEKNDLVVVETVAHSLERDPAYASHCLYLTAALALRAGDINTALERAVAAKENPDLLIEANVLAGEAAYKIGAAGKCKAPVGRSAQGRSRMHNRSSLAGSAVL